MTLTKEAKSEVIRKFASHEGDTGSPEVQVALLTARINELTEHLRTHKNAGRPAPAPVELPQQAGRGPLSVARPGARAPALNPPCCFE